MDVLPMCAWPARVMVVAGCSSGSGYRSRCVPRFLGGRCRPNTMLAAAYDLKVFFTVVAGRRIRSGRPSAFTCCSLSSTAPGACTRITAHPTGARVTQQARYLNRRPAPTALLILRNELANLMCRRTHSGPAWRGGHAAWYH